MTKRRILITGTTGGIGSAVKRAALAAGYEVAELNRGEFEDLEALRQRFSSGSVTSLVFCTGTCPVKPLTQMTDEEFAETMRVNCGLFIRVLRQMVTEKLYDPDGMKVVAISSVSATEGWAGGAAYCASKGALSAACRALNVELKSKKISVVALEPRYVKTRMFDAVAGRMGVDSALAQNPDEFAKEILHELDR